MLAGRPHEAVGNGSPRWMTAAPRKRGTEPGLQAGVPPTPSSGLRARIGVHPPASELTLDLAQPREHANIDAVLVGGNGQNYSADYDGIAGYTNFDSGTIHVAQGDTVTGAVTFQVPDGITVSKVQWTAVSGFGLTVEWNVHG